MEIISGVFSTDDSLSLHYKNWPASDAAPCVVYMHGLESHLGWFSNLAEFLNKEGMNIYAFDRRGSGLNKQSGKNFYTNYILKDLKLFLDLVRKQHPYSKIFLIGLCLGGKIAVSFFSFYSDQVDGLILISPSLKTKLSFSLLEKLSILLKPNYMARIPIEDNMFTLNSKFLDYIGSDPLRLRRIPGQYLLEIAKMDRLINPASDNIRIPMLLMLAGIDKIIDTNSVRRWYNKVPSLDKKIKIYSDYHHILTFEEKADDVMRDIADWITERAHA